MLTWSVAVSHAQSPTGSASLSQQFRAAAKGSPVMFVHAGTKLIVRSAGKGLAKTLADNVEAAAYDDRLELIWYVSRGAIFVVDLRRSALATVRITASVGKTRAVASLRIEHRKRDITGGRPHTHREHFKLEWSKSAKATKSSFTRLQLVGRDWLANNYMRKLGPELSWKFKASKKRVKLGRGRDCRFYEDECGTFVVLPNTGHWLVRTAYHTYSAWGGIKHHCSLYNKRRKRWSRPAPRSVSWKKSLARAPKGPCLHVYDKSRRYFIVSNRVCSATKCSRLRATFVAWLDGGGRLRS